MVASFVAAELHRRAGVAAGACDAEVELEHVVLPGAKIDDAVAVEVADDREAAQSRW